MKNEFKLTYDPDCRVPDALEELAAMERPLQMKAARALIRRFVVDLNERAGLHLDDVVQLFSSVPEWVTNQRHAWERSQVKVKWWRCCDCGTIDRELAFFGVGTIATCPRCKKVNAVKISEEQQEKIEGELGQRPAPKSSPPPLPRPPFNCPSVDTCGLKERWDSCYDCPAGHGPKKQEEPGDRKAPSQQSHITPRQMLQWAEETDRVLCEEAQSAAELAKKQEKSQEKPGDRKAPPQPNATAPKLGLCPICRRDSLRQDGKCDACGADLSGVNVELIRAAWSPWTKAFRSEMLEMAQRAPQRSGGQTNCVCNGHTCPVCSTAGRESKIVDHYCAECSTRYCPTCHNITEALMVQAYSSCGKCKCDEKGVK